MQEVKNFRTVSKPQSIPDLTSFFMPCRAASLELFSPGISARFAFNSFYMIKHFDV